MQCIEYEVIHSAKSNGFDSQTSKIKANSESDLKRILESRGRKLTSIRNKKLSSI